MDNDKGELIEGDTKNNNGIEIDVDTDESSDWTDVYKTLGESFERMANLNKQFTEMSVNLIKTYEPVIDVSNALGEIASASFLNLSRSIDTIVMNKNFESFQKITVNVARLLLQSAESMNELTTSITKGLSVESIQNILEYIESNTEEAVLEEDFDDKTIEELLKKLKEKDINETIEEEIKSKKTKKSIIVIIYFLICFFNEFWAFGSNINSAYEQVTSMVLGEKVEYIKRVGFETQKSEFKWIEKEVKKHIPVNSRNSIRLVKIDGLKMREGKKMESKVVAELEYGAIVQVLEKRKNWTYIAYIDEEAEIYVEGWTHTRYLKQIK